MTIVSWETKFIFKFVKNPSGFIQRLILNYFRFLNVSMFSNHWADTKKELGFSWSSCKIGYSSCFHRKYPKIVKNRKIDGPYQRNFFWAVSWVLFKIHQFHLKFDGDHESVSFFYHSSIVEELSVYFRTIWVF